MRMIMMTLAALVGLSGCNALSSAAGVGWPTDVFTVDIGGIYGHDLSDGAPIDLEWASDSSFACWVGTENQNFDGNHVFFGLTQPANTFLTVAATPEPGLDVSLYLMQMGTDTFIVPPSTDAYPLSCDAGFDQVHDANPGEVEYIETLGYEHDVNVLIGVAGVNGGSSGAFELELYAEEI
ncbi:MAG: hypothetical protein JXX28_15900 [Deltaproteobacteria bacterium]|nr:hypothetical protein [Deltaproteobacteria bacterium]